MVRAERGDQQLAETDADNDSKSKKGMLRTERNHDQNTEFWKNNKKTTFCGWKYKILSNLSRQLDYIASFERAIDWDLKKF